MTKALQTTFLLMLVALNFNEGMTSNHTKTDDSCEQCKAFAGVARTFLNFELTKNAFKQTINALCNTFVTFWYDASICSGTVE